MLQEKMRAAVVDRTYSYLPPKDRDFIKKSNVELGTLIESHVRVPLIGPELAIELMMSQFSELEGLTSAMLIRCAIKGFPLEVTSVMRDLLKDTISASAFQAMTGYTVAQFFRHETKINYSKLGTKPPESKWERLAVTLALPPLASTGYQNGNFVMIGWLIEHLTGESYPDFMQRRVFKRAHCHEFRNMNDQEPQTRYYQSTEIGQDQTSLLNRMGTTFPDFPEGDGAAGWYAPSNNVARLFDAVRRFKLFSETSTNEMLFGHFGWYEGNPFGAYYGHNGGWGWGDGLGGSGGLNSWGGLLPGSWTVYGVISSDGPNVEGAIHAAFRAALPLITAKVAGAVKTCEIVNRLGSGTVRFTIDGSDPTNASPAYTAPFAVASPNLVRAAVFDVDLQFTGVQREFITVLESAIAPDGALGATPLRGLKRKYKAGAFANVQDFVTKVNLPTGVTTDISYDGFSIERWRDKDNFGVMFEGLLKVQVEGSEPKEFTFLARSDDGIRMDLGGVTVLLDSEAHGPRDVITKVKLSNGFYKIRLWFYELGGGETLELSWRRPGGELERIPASELWQ